MSAMMKVVDSPRPATRQAEDRYLLAAYRGALERIATTLHMPGSASLVEDVPAAVERFGKLAELLRRENW